MIIDEAYLYKYMPEAEWRLMAQIPSEEELYHKFSRRFERKMKALIKYERRTPWERKFYGGMKLAFAALIVVLVLAFGSAMSVKAYRYRFVEFIVEVLEELTSYSVQEEKPDGEIANLIEPGYIPKGYRVTKRVSNNAGYYLLYENGLGGEIHYRQAANNALERLLDTETSEVQDIYLDGKVLHVIEEDAVRTVHWNDEDYVYSIVVKNNAGDDELLKIVRSILRK